MKVLQVNSIDNRGGAAKVASRLASELASLNNQVSMLVGHRVGGIPDTEEIHYTENSKKINRRFHLRSAFLPTDIVLNLHPYFKTAEIVHFHNLHLEPDGYFNIRSLRELSSQKPSVWTLHDPWLIFEQGKTPQYDNFFSNIPFWYNLLKRNSVHHSNVVLVSPSNWLKDLVQKYYPEKQVKVIPNGIDTSIFRPLNIARSRKDLGLPEDKKIILFVANEGEDNLDKGSRFIDIARSAFRNQKVIFISLGSSRKGTYITSDKDMAKYYSAADVFLLPSLAENLPLTILEAMACGTPAVAFDTGGVSEIINHLKNGYIAQHKNSNDLLNGIQTVLDSQEKMSDKAVHTIKSSFSLTKMTDSYLELYSSII